jgi:Protein of unknown function (DUF1440)
MKSKQKERSRLPHKSKSRILGREFLCGLAGGLAGAWMMPKFTKSLASGAALNSQLLPYDAQEWDATSRIAENCGIRILGRALSPQELKTGAAVVHYATGATAGAFYGMMASRGKRRSRWSGAVFGVVVWLVGNQLLLPAMGVIHRDDYSHREKLSAFGGHLAFGLTTDLVCQQLVQIVTKTG